MKQIDVTIRSVEFTTFRVEVEDDFDPTDIAEIWELPPEEYPEVHSETMDASIVELFNHETGQRTFV